VEIGEPLVKRRAELETAGWDVEILPGLDHLGAMCSEMVLPLLMNWLRRV